jgi:F-type H+-transporting ATPase subunit epsilon
MPIRCEIVTQDRVLFEGDVDVVVAPGVEGEIGVLPHHAPLLTTLDFGILRLRKAGEEEVFTIAGGVMEVRPDIVTVLADVGEHVEEIDVERAQEARERAERRLKEEVPRGTDEYLAIEAALRRSKLRLEAASKYRRRLRRPPESPPPGGEN